MKKISGEFEVQLEKLPESLKSTSDFATQRFGLRKTFRGELEGTAVGEMMAAGSLVSGAGGYVAIDIVTATIEGRRGSFLLMHFGTRTKTDQHLRVEVVPSSGTGELANLQGSLGIRIEGGKHFYDFEYSL